MKCPFCGWDWRDMDSIRVDLSNAINIDEVSCEPYVCGCGAIWYEGMEDVDDARGD